MKVAEIKKGIYWVGAVDWGIRDFHGYIIPEGTSYNNYLIMDENPTLIDTVKHDFAHITLDNIRSLIDPHKIRYVVINHIEPDHASSAAEIMEACPLATMYMTEKGRNGLAKYFDISKWTIHTVKTGDTLHLGKRTLLFVETPMLHWPDSMFTYVQEEKLLFSQDVFGQHIATACRFDDEYTDCESVSMLDDAVLDYYANILMPFGSLAKMKLDEVAKLKLEIDMIAPDHGIIWRKGVSKIVRMYQDMASLKARLSVAIIYDTMWESTAQMVQPILNGVLDGGVECKVIKLRATPMSVAVKELWRGRGAIIGSPTLNNGLFPSVAEFLRYLRGLRPKGRLMGAFGSMGWSGGAVKEAYGEFEKMGLEVVEPGIECIHRPDTDDAEKCYQYGLEFAKRVKEYDKKF